ncbi:MAG: hypothetical protein HOO67_07750 [Candidatus Peribacteraceae bacterium]|nr:hypothetical protein [Candidatus Peribacteraceae bacterium]
MQAHEKNGQTPAQSADNEHDDSASQQQTDFQAAYIVYHESLANGAPVEVLHEQYRTLYRLHLQSLVSRGMLPAEKAKEIWEKSEKDLRPNELRPHDFRVRYLTQDMNDDDANEANGTRVVFENGYWFSMHQNGWKRMTREEVLEHFGHTMSILYYGRMVVEKIKSCLTSAEPNDFHPIAPEKKNRTGMQKSEAAA